jgi:UDP-glucose 4-epimerase
VDAQDLSLNRAKSERGQGVLVPTLKEEAMHVLVTGGAGFIGSHLVDAYLERGWRVSVIDDFSAGRRRNINEEADYFEADLRDPSTCELLQQLRPDVINHHAAQIDVRNSVTDPARDAEINVVASIRLLQKCVDSGVKRFIFASSGGAIYGEPVSAPQAEDHPARPMSPYGCAKLSVEHYLNCAKAIYGLATVALRYANVYGPRQNSSGEAGVVAIFIDRLLRHDVPIINGTGEQTRDFTYVGDVVAANIAVSDDWSITGALNVGTGSETSINELYAALAQITGTTEAARRGPAKPGEQMRSVLDGMKLRGAMKLPTPVSLQTGLARTVEWFREEARLDSRSPQPAREH